MINKVAESVAEALSDVQDGATVLIGGFGTAGIPSELIDGLIALGTRGLTVVNNNAGNGDVGLAALLKAGRRRTGTRARHRRRVAEAPQLQPHLQPPPRRWPQGGDTFTKSRELIRRINSRLFGGPPPPRHPSAIASFQKRGNCG